MVMLLEILLIDNLKQDQEEEKEKKSTIKFIDYLITGNNHGEPNATPEYREALVKDIKSGK